MNLTGRTIVVTRARGQASQLSEKLRALGAEVVELPTIEIRPAADYSPLDRAIERLDSYDWVIFTSVNGVHFFLRRLEALGRRDALGTLRARICTIGPATRRAVEALGLQVCLMPDQYVAESLVEAFRAYDLRRARILLPRAAVARDLVPAELSRLGAQVDVVEAYRTAIPEESAQLARQIFESPRKPDWITFTSSSTVTNFLRIAGADALNGVRVASIGPVTTATARRHGITVAAEAASYTIDGLVEAILSAESAACHAG